MTGLAVASLPLETAIERAGGLPADVVHGLDLLARSRPLWPVDDVVWRGAVDSVGRFAARWDGRARAVGWSTLELYGLHRCAPYANLAGMGAAFVVARCGHRVVDVGAGAIDVRSRSGADLLIYRRELETESVLAWSLCVDR